MKLFQGLQKFCRASARSLPFVGNERRRAPRYPSEPNQARMTWQCGGLEVMNAVEVLEISSTGALVRSSKLPHTRQRVWIRVEDPFRTEWYEAEVVRIQDGDQVALLFPQSCPFDLYKATRGVKSIERGPEYSSPEFNSRDWH